MFRPKTLQMRSATPDPSRSPRRTHETKLSYLAYASLPLRQGH